MIYSCSQAKGQKILKKSCNLVYILLISWVSKILTNTTIFYIASNQYNNDNEYELLNRNFIYLFILLNIIHNGIQIMIRLL